MCQHPVTRVLCDQEEQDETQTRCPHCPWRGHARAQSDGGRAAGQPQHGSASSTRDRFWYEPILPRLDKTVPWLFLLLRYLYYLKIWASKHVCPGASQVVPFSQQYSLRSSSPPPLSQDLILESPSCMGKNYGSEKRMSWTCTSGFLAWDVSKNYCVFLSSAFPTCLSSRNAGHASRSKLLIIQVIAQSLLYSKKYHTWLKSL